MSSSSVMISMAIVITFLHSTGTIAVQSSKLNLDTDCSISKIYKENKPSTLKYPEI